MKKNLPKILAVSLLLIVAVLMVFAGSDSIQTLMKNSEKNASYTNNIDVAEAGTDKTSQADNGDTNAFSVEKQAEEANALNVFPIKANTQTDYIWEQTISTNAPISLCNVHQITSCIYLVISVPNCKGTISSDNQSICVAKCDYDGNILNLIALKFENDIKYLASSVSDEGLIIVSTDGKKTFVSTIDYLSNSKYVFELPYCENARIFALSNGFILLTENKQNNVYRFSGGVISASSTLQSGEIVDIFEEESSYSVFVNGVNGYSIIKLNKNLYCYSVNTIPEKNIIKVLPVAENNEQSYITLESGKGNIDIVKYDNSFNVSSAVKVSLGLAERGMIYNNTDTIFISIKNSENRIYVSDMSLNFASSNATLLKNAVKIFQTESYSGGYLMLITEDNKQSNLTLIDVKNDGSSSKKLVPVYTENAYILRCLQKDKIIAYEYEGMIKMIRVD